ncbi:cell division cycle protein 27 homolog [Diorhabda carinulata]|uniref:cell division cycle protein 27 homolog n=1 Tax=Diorhabda carinulata TaxID=1163345 RepID=UPI0025A03508|nr:cell division cycle protein 27 homolog [Diorhabda carinulata]
MIVQEPVQAAIWHCLNNYNYPDAIFLSERLYAEVNTEESLYLLATAYFRSGKCDHAYYILKDRTGNSAQCRYLLGTCAYELEKYAEAEATILENCTTGNNLDDEDLVKEFGDQACFVFLLLGKIAAKTERKNRAIEAWKKALKLNPFLWSGFENLCKIGEKKDPATIFQISNIDSLSMCQGNSISNLDSVIITSNIPPVENEESFITTPEQVFTNSPVFMCNQNFKQFTSPDDSPLAHPLALSGLRPLAPTMQKNLRSRFRDLGSTPLSHESPAFGQLFDSSFENMNTPDMFSPATLTESNNHHQSLVKRVRAQVDQFIGRKESIFQNCKPVFSQSTNVPVTKTPTIPLAVQPGQNVRRSSRLFSNSYSVKENNKSPSRNKFATPKSPSRKTKQRIAKCNLNKNTNYSEMNTKNKIEKEKNETVTSAADVKTEKSAILNTEGCLQQVVNMQKQSAEGLMCLLRDIGQAYVDLSQFNCSAAIERLSNLPPNQFNTSWVQCLIGLAYFEKSDFENSIKYFGEVHNKEPYRLDYMDIYSTALWHLQKEVALSALAQDLINTSKTSPITWCVNGNCFSLHKEHDTAIKFFQRAVQLDPNFPYAYTLLGHEYITTEELDKAMSCFRNAIRLDPRHYNAWFGIGTIYSKQERYHLAEMNYSKALAINSKSSVILCHIGVVQHALKETEKALATFNKAIANNPNSPLCKFHRGSIYFALGRHAEALKELEELKEIVPKESLVYYLIGKVHKKLGNTDLALMHFSWATDLDPKGASSQIKEAFDPSIGRSTTEIDSPISPAPYEYQSESNSGQRFGPLNFNGMPDDSEDSF